MGRERTSAPLIERDRELSLLADAVTGLERSHGSVVLVDGPAGIGKTRLLDAGCELARGAGATVLRARGVEVERAAPFGVVRQLLERQLLTAASGLRDEWTAGAASLALPVLGTEWLGDDHDLRVEPTVGLFHGLYWLVANMSASAPLAFVVDDAHWSDPHSLRALAYLGRRLEGVAAVVVLGCRTEVESFHEGPLREFSNDSEVVRVTVGPLTPTGTGRLVDALAKVPVEPGAVAICHDTAGGNPFLVGEIIYVLEQTGAPVTGSAVAKLAETGADSLTHAVMLRLGALGADAVAVAGAVSVLDLDSRLSHAAALAGLDVAATADAADRLAGAHIFADSTPLKFAHPLLRAAVYGDLTALQRTLLHGRAAAILRAAGASRERIATHLLETEPARDPQTAALLLRAASDVLAQGAPASAARYLRRALAEPPEDARRGEVLVALGTAELQAGENSAAEEVLAEALAIVTEPQRRLEAALLLAPLLAQSAGHTTAVATLDAVAPGLEGDLALRLDVERTTLGLYVPELAASCGQRMREYAGFAGTTASERSALAVAALATAFDPGASATAALGLAHRALADGALIAELTSDSTQYASVCYVLNLAEDLDGSERNAERTFDDARARGSAFGFGLASSMLCMSALCRGRLADATAHAEAEMAATRELPRTPVNTRFFDAGVAVLRAAALVPMGELGRAREIVTEASGLGDLDTLELSPIRYARALVEMEDGDHGAALADFVAHGAVCAQIGFDDRFLTWRLGAARAELALGRREEAATRVEEALAITRAWGAPGGLGATLRVLALVGDAGERCDRLAQAVDVLRSSLWQLELAGALVDYGVALRTSGQRREAREAIEEGMDIATLCGARPLIERARGELSILGARPRRLMFSGVESLTASERRVAAMAAEGMTNRAIAQSLFVTQKTVENHLANAFRKLDIRSRRELQDELAKVPG